MGIRFRKSMKIAPGVRLNFGKNSVGISAGVKGARVSVNSKGRVTKTLSVPGTGLSYVTTSQLGSSDSKKQNTPPAPPEPPQNNFSNGPKEPKKIPRWLIYVIIAFIAGMINPNFLFPAMLVECIFNYIYVKGHVFDDVKRKRSKILTTVFLIFSIIGCFGSIGASAPPSVETLTVSAVAQKLDVNESQTLTWAYTPEGADISQLSAVVSDDTLAQATINDNGELVLETLSKEGTVDVSLKDGEVISNVVTFTIVDAEKEAERIAAEKAEAERIAAEKAEAERIAAEKAEAERVAAEQAAAQAAASQQSSQQTNSRTVYVTPTGKKYHYNSNCNGGSYSPTTLEKALAMNLTPCKKCVG